MFKRGVMAAVAAASLVSAPALAQSASKLSVVQSARTSASADGEKLAGGSTLIGIAVFVALAAVVYFVAEGNDSSPASK